MLCGDGGLGLGKVLSPKPAEIREMLLAIRKHLAWSQFFTAAVLGVTKSAIVKWESGEREARGAAAKLIFLLYSQVVERKDKVRNAWDLAFWGKIPCRGSLKAVLAIGATYFVSQDKLFDICALTVTDAPELSRNQRTAQSQSK